MPVKRGKTKTLISILLILAVDQCTKLWVYSKLGERESIPLIRNILHITFVRNTGAAFGLFKQGTFIFILISLAAVVFISLLILGAIKKGRFSSSSPQFDFGLIFILSGALGNLVDRVRFGYVVDFIDVRIWPVFNMADMAITIGTGLLIFSFLRQEKRIS